MVYMGYNSEQDPDRDPVRRAERQRNRVMRAIRVSIETPHPGLKAQETLPKGSI